MDLIRLTARIVLDSANYERGIDKATTKAKKATTEMGKATQETEKLSKKTKSLAGEYESYGDTVEEVNDSIKALNNSKRLEQKLFDSGKISLSEYNSDMENLNSQLKDAKTQLAGMSGGGASFGQVGIIAGLIGIFVKMVKKVVAELKEAEDYARNHGTDVSNSARAAGISETQFQRIQSLIGLSGGDYTSAAESIRAVSDLYDKAKSGDYEASKTLKQLGLSTSDLANLDNAARFEAVVSRLQGMDYTDRAKSAEEIFGSGVYDTIIPLIDSERSFNDLYEEAVARGAIMTEEGIRQRVEYAKEHAVDQYIDDMDKATGRNFFTKIGDVFSGTIQHPFAMFDREIFNRDEYEQYGENNVVKNTTENNVVRNTAENNVVRNTTDNYLVRNYIVDNPAEHIAANPVQNNIEVRVQIGDKEFKDYVYETTQEALDERGLK